MPTNSTEQQVDLYRHHGFPVTARVSSASGTGAIGNGLEVQERRRRGLLAGAGRSLTTRRLLLVALAAIPFSAQGQPQSAEAFVRAIYAPYLAGGNQGQEYTRFERFFAPDVARLMKADAVAAQKRNELPKLDSDPFVDAQDWEIRNFALSVKESGTSATAVATFDNSGRAMRIVLDLVQTPQGWRISDIRAPSGSLRALYR